jgi:hypothetical protein
VPTEIRASYRELEDPRTSFRRLAGADGIGVPLVSRSLREQSLYPYHIQRVQAPTSPDHRARVVFCQRLLAKCVVNTQFVANILFTDEAGFIKECTVNFRNGHVWVNGNPPINVWVRILGDEPFGSVVLPQRLTGAVYHRFMLSDIPVGLILEHVLRHQRQRMWWGII